MKQDNRPTGEQADDVAGDRALAVARREHRRLMQMAAQGRDVRNERTPDTSEEPLTPYVGAQEALNRELDSQRPFRVDRRIRYRPVTPDDDEEGRALCEWDPYGPISRSR